jgi:uncharacterized protein (TIGR04255 family)
VGHSPYSNPPITEAVIEIRFSNPCGEELQTKLSSKLAKFYPVLSDLTQQRVGVDLVQQSIVQDSTRLFRRSNNDVDQIVLIGAANFITSNLAPYTGWDEFFGRFKRDWDELKKVYGYQKIERVGVRYINRLDIPTTQRVANEDAFLKVYIKCPDILEPKLGYSFQIVKPIDDIKCMAVINSASIESPIPDSVAVMLDIDIGRTLEVPQKDDDIFALINSIRISKNTIFEASITDEARKGFNNDSRLG